MAEAPGGSRSLDVVVRGYEDSDQPAVMELLGASLGWVPGEQMEAFFRWKHLENPFGRSPMWVATIDARVVGFRSFLAWNFSVDGEPQRAVRAVDTATHPDVQGRGLFRTLTLGAVEHLARSGVAFVFNTPNEQSRPGYLKMGWQEVGRLPLAACVAGPRSVLRLSRARVAADRWSLPCQVGVPASAILDEPGVVEAALAPPSEPGVQTAWSADALRWRYGLADLHYRALPLDDDSSNGLAVFRVRRRGPAREATIAAIIGVEASGGHGRLVRQVLRATDADVATVLGSTDPAHLLLHLPRMGPVLTHRPLASPAPIPLPRWRLEMGDIELF